MPSAETISMAGVETGGNIGTRVIDDEGLALLPSIRDQYSSLISYMLLEWALDPEQLLDEGLTPPTVKAFQRAVELLGRLSRRGISPPDRVSPDGDGGVSFEWAIGSDQIYMFTILRDGSPTDVTV